MTQVLFAVLLALFSPPSGSAGWDSASFSVHMSRAVALANQANGATLRSSVERVAALRAALAEQDRAWPLIRTQEEELQWHALRFQLLARWGMSLDAIESTRGLPPRITALMIDKGLDRVALEGR